MLEFLGIIILVLIGVIIGRTTVLNILINEKEDKRVQFKGKIYKFSFEEEEVV